DYADCGGGALVNILAPSIDYVDVKDGSDATNRRINSNPTEFEGTNLAAGNHRADYTAFLANTNNSMWMYQSCDIEGCGSNVNPIMNNYPSFMADATAIQN